MGLVARLQAAENGDRVLDVGFVDDDRLETPFQGGVFFHVFAILVQRRGADAAELAAGQGRLEQVGGVAAAFGAAGADDRMQLVDEEHDVSSAGNFLQDGLEPLFELAAELRAGHQGAHVQGDDAAVFEAFGHVAVDDPQGQALDNGRLAHAGLADQHGIVLRAPGQDLDHAADFLVAADHGVELSLPGPLDEVDAVALQGLELGLRVLVGDPLAAADGLHGLEQFLVREGVELEDILGLRVDLRECQEEVLGGDELVLHGVGLALGGLQHADQFTAGLRGRSAADLGQALQLAADDAFQLRTVGADAIQQRRDHAVGFAQESFQQVERLDLGMALVGGQRLGVGDGLLAFDREFFVAKCHSNGPLSRLPYSAGWERVRVRAS